MKDCVISAAMLTEADEGCDVDTDWEGEVMADSAGADIEGIIEDWKKEPSLSGDPKRWWSFWKVSST